MPTAEVVFTKNALPTLIARLPGAVDAVLSAGMERVAEYARQNHPWQNQTGQTEASIHMEQTGDHEFAAVAGGAMIYLEWGTVNMPPFPTMAPAYDAVEPSIEQALQGMGNKFL